MTSLVRQLHSRDSRRQFCSEGHWLSHKVAIDPTQVSQFILISHTSVVDNRPFPSCFEPRYESEAYLILKYLVQSDPLGRGGAGRCLF